MRIVVRVRPGAPQTRVGGRLGEGEHAALTVAVHPRAVAGAANEALRSALADAFGIRPRQVSIVRGERSRTKLVELDIDPAVGRVRLAALQGR